MEVVLLLLLNNNDLRHSFLYNHIYLSTLKLKYFLLFIAITALGLLFFYSQAKSKANKQTITTEDISQGIPDDFLPFYNQFHEDTSFQMAHINFPLQGIKTIEGTGGGEDYMYARDEWIIHKPFDDMSGTFSRSFEEFAGIIVETIMANGGQFRSVRRWAKLGDEWNLIFYQPMGMY